MSGNEHETGDPWLPKPDAGGMRGTIPPMVHRNIRGNTMDIGGAVKHLVGGGRVARAGWNGKGMWLVYAPGGTFNRMIDDLPDGNLVQFIVMKTADDKFVPWLASQSDLLATDWEVAV